MKGILTVERQIVLSMHLFDRLNLARKNMAHNPEDSAGAQLALVVAVKLLLSAYKRQPKAIDLLTNELERMRADLLGTSSTDRKLGAFNDMAEALLDVLRNTDTQ